MFFKSGNQYSGKNFLGKRHSEKKKYAWITYEEAKSYSEDLAKSIIEKEFFTKTEEGLRLFGMGSQSCPETTLIDFACLQAEITSVSIDYGLGDIQDSDEESFQIQCKSKVEKFKAIVEATNINTIFGSLQVLKTVMRLKNKDELKGLKHFVGFDETSEEIETDWKSIENFEVFNLTTVINYGSELPIGKDKGG